MGKRGKEREEGRDQDNLYTAPRHRTAPNKPLIHEGKKLFGRRRRRSEVYRTPLKTLRKTWSLGNVTGGSLIGPGFLCWATNSVPIAVNDKDDCANRCYHGWTPNVALSVTIS